MSEFYQNAEKETAELVRRLKAQGDFELQLKTMSIDELVDMVEKEIHALNSTGHSGHRFHVSLINAELNRRGRFAT